LTRVYINERRGDLKNILLITDLDGTLLNGQQKISLENKNAVRDFIDNGGFFTIATGRAEKAVKRFVEELNISLPLILYNGAKIIDPITWDVLYEWNYELPLDIWGQLAELENEEIGILFYQHSEIYTTAKNDTVLKYEKKDQVIVNLKTTPFKDPITKLLLIGNSESLDKLEHLFKNSGLSISLVYSESHYLEVLPYGVSKGSAVKLLKSYFNNPTPYTICVGDNLNDCSMFVEADEGIAVGNAHPKLKEIANFVTVDHKKHAMASIISKLDLNSRY